MALETETVIDRRRLSRAVSFWRFLALIFALLVVLAIVLGNRQFAGEAGFFPQIARVQISGMITDDRHMTSLLDELAKEREVKAVILDINSPGGTASGGEALYLAIRRLAAKKPVVAVCGTLAASAAYLAALATDHIVALGNTMTGSVGIIFQWVDVSKLMNTIGVKVEEQRSGPLKAVPDPFHPADAQTLQFTQQMVDEAKQWFFGVVKQRRKIDLAAVPGLTQGRVYSGRQALQYKLIDQIGDEHTALQWLHQKNGISSHLSVVDWRPENESEGYLGSLFHTMAQVFVPAADNIAGALGEVSAPLQLDGLISLWHARGN
jgi:protease IV